jgi:hypothetical protein
LHLQSLLFSWKPLGILHTLCVALLTLVGALIVVPLAVVPMVILAAIRWARTPWQGPNVHSLVYNIVLKLLKLSPSLIPLLVEWWVVGWFLVLMSPLWVFVVFPMAMWVGFVYGILEEVLRKLLAWEGFMRIVKYTWVNIVYVVFFGLNAWLQGKWPDWRERKRDVYVLISEMIVYGMNLASPLVLYGGLAGWYILLNWLQVH